VVSTRDGRWSFLSLGRQVAVMSSGGRVPRLVRLIDVPGAPRAETLSHDGRYLLLTDGGGPVVLSVSRAEKGVAHPVLGTLASPGGAGGAIDLATSPDDQYAFVTLETRGVVAVFDLRAALARGFHGAGYVGAIPLGVAPLGIAISPDGQWLYATSELTTRQAGSGRSQGTLSVIDVRRAERQPASALVGTAIAGCNTARVAVSPDGQTVWATARRSNAVLGYSAAKLLRDPRHALMAVVRVGQQPIGLGFVDGGRRMIAFDSNPQRTPGQATGLTVVDPAAAIAGRAAVLGTLATGPYPREVTLAPSGQTLLVTRFSGGEGELVRAADLP
jgi:DNA-binding beta-propeller fold protein YncE